MSEERVIKIFIWNYAVNDVRQILWYVLTKKLSTMKWNMQFLTKALSQFQTKRDSKNKTDIQSLTKSSSSFFARDTCRIHNEIIKFTTAMKSWNESKKTCKIYIFL